jgi:hypothetical protein
MKAQDFLLGLRDFFAVLVPGAVFLLLVGPVNFLDPEAQKSGGSGQWIFAFAIGAYLVGSVMSAIGSWLDLIVDPVLEGRRLPGFLRREIVGRKRLAGRLRDRALKSCEVLGVARHRESLRSFWWDQLRLNCPPAAAQLERMEATQKLFRSLIPVLLLTPAGRALLGNPADTHLKWLIGGTVVAFILYVAGRYLFLLSVYRLGIAACVRLRQD